MKKIFSIFCIFAFFITLKTYAETYNINIGDVLEIFIWQEPELNRSVTVGPDGNISFPLIGNIKAEGLNTQSLTEILKEKLSKHIKNPEITVTIKQIKDKKIYIFGEVLKPGEYNLEEKTTLMKAISKAGGYKGESANLSSIFVLREDKESKKETRLQINLKKFISEEDINQNIPMEPDDVIYIPSIPKESSNIYVLGEVGNPGEYSLDDKITLIKAITKAGGYKGESADLSSIFILREDKESKKEIRIEKNLKNFILSGDMEQDITIAAGDVVYVPKIYKKVYILGEVRNPGVYNIEDATGVLETISLAGGYNVDLADMKKIMIVRKDAMEKNEISNVNLEKFIEMGDPSQNIEIKNGDIIYIPRGFNKVYVLGEVSLPGVYSLEEETSVIEIIARAGGYKNTAALKSVMVVRKLQDKEEPLVKILNLAEIIKSGNINQDMPLSPGDVVYVPKKFIAKVGDFVKFFFTDINPALDTYLKAYEVINIKAKYDYYKRNP